MINSQHIVKVLLIYPDTGRNSSAIGYGELGAIAEPLALEYLVAAIIDIVDEFNILDLRLHAGELENSLANFSPDVVAITGYSMHVIRVLEIAKIVREYNSNIKIIVGGHHATLLPEDFTNDFVDYVIIGEGTVPLRILIKELIKCADHNNSDLKVPGVWYKNKNHWVFTGNQANLALKDMPHPLRSCNLEDRKKYFISWMRPIASFRTSVGCPYRCSFCSLWKIMDGRYYKQSVESVIAEVIGIAEPYMFLVDDEPFVNANRMDLLAENIKKQGIKKQYYTYCRADTLIKNKELIEKWVDIGLNMLFLGIEGVTDREMEIYNKRLSISQIEEGIRIARSLGIKIHGSFIVNPCYTKKDFVRLSRFIERNRIDYPSFTILTPLPGTEDFIKNYRHITEWQSNGRPDWSKWDLQHLVVPSVLPKEKFLKEYRNLHTNFIGSYEVYQKKAFMIYGF